MKLKLLKCSKCGNIVAVVKESGVDIICCGEPMQEIEPNTVDASMEKHVPVCELDGCKVHVKVGSEKHPMTQDHHIEWIAIQTDKRFRLETLMADEEPECCFEICDGEKVESVYAYCNLHGLWMAK